MKLKAVEKLCKASGCVRLIDDPSLMDGAVPPSRRQWISDGVACYPLDGLPYLDETEFTEAEEAPDEGTFRAALVIATNEEQITVQFDETERAWVYYEGRWLRENGGHLNGR